MIGIAVLLLASAPANDGVITDDDRRTVRQFAQCAVDRDPKTAAAFVLDPGATMKGVGRKLFGGRCLQWGKLSGWVEGYRYAFAEALVLREFPAAPPAGLDAAAALDHRVPAGTPDPKAEPAAIEKVRRVNGARLALSMLGDCVARTDTASAYALLKTRPGSAEEGAAVAALMPATQQCVEEGASVELTRPGLRGAVALNLYRLAKAPRLAQERG